MVIDSNFCDAMIIRVASRGLNINNGVHTAAKLLFLVICYCVGVKEKHALIIKGCCSVFSSFSFASGMTKQVTSFFFSVCFLID